MQDVSELRSGMVIKGIRSGLIGMLSRLIPNHPIPCDNHRIGQCSVWKTIGRSQLWCLQLGVDHRSLYRLETGQSDEAQQREGRDLYAPKKVGVKA